MVINLKKYEYFINESIVAQTAVNLGILKTVGELTANRGISDFARDAMQVGISLISSLVYPPAVFLIPIDIMQILFRKLVKIKRIEYIIKSEKNPIKRKELSDKLKKSNYDKVRIFSQLEELKKKGQERLNNLQNSGKPPQEIEVLVKKCKEKNLKRFSSLFHDLLNKPMDGNDVTIFNKHYVGKYK